MPIIAVTRWQAGHDEARSAMRDVASRLKQAGAQTITVGRITTGAHADQVIVAVTYENYEAMGRAMQALHSDQQYQQRINELRKTGALQERTLIHAEEITTSS